MCLYMYTVREKTRKVGTTARARIPLLLTLQLFFLPHDWPWERKCASVCVHISRHLTAFDPQPLTGTCIYIWYTSFVDVPLNLNTSFAHPSPQTNTFFLIFLLFFLLFHCSYQCSFSYSCKSCFAFCCPLCQFSWPLYISTVCCNMLSSPLFSLLHRFVVSFSPSLSFRRSPALFLASTTPSLLLPSLPLSPVWSGHHRQSGLLPSSCSPHYWGNIFPKCSRREKATDLLCVSIVSNVRESFTNNIPSMRAFDGGQHWPSLYPGEAQSLELSCSLSLPLYAICRHCKAGTKRDILQQKISTIRDMLSFV